MPPASFTIFPMLALAVWIPLYDLLVVPWLRRLTGVEGGVTLLQRMGVGMVLSVVAMRCRCLQPHRSTAPAFAEVEVLGHLRHRNIVRLLGWCTDGEATLLLYEYMSNGSLDDLLHGAAGADAAGKAGRDPGRGRSPCTEEGDERAGRRGESARGDARVGRGAAAAGPPRRGRLRPAGTAVAHWRVTTRRKSGG